MQYVISSQYPWDTVAYIQITGGKARTVTKDGKVAEKDYDLNILFSYLSSGVWKFCKEEEAKALLTPPAPPAPKEYSFDELQTTAPVGTYMTNKGYGTLHVAAFGNKRAVFYIHNPNGNSGNVEPANDCWKPYQFVKCNDVKLKLEWVK